MRTRMSHPESAGVTLVELMIVLTLIGVLATIVVPNANLGRFRVNAAMHSIGSTIMTAQRHAVSRQHDVVVRFDTANGVIAVHSDADNDGVVDVGELFRKEPLGEAIVFGRGTAPPLGSATTTVTFTRMSEGLPSVTFHRNGSASQSGGFYLVSPRTAYGESAHNARYVEILRATGRVSWHRYDGFQWKRGF